jgi:hypothetical protein
MDLQLYYSTDTGPLAQRNWIPVTNLESGSIGREHVLADSVAGIAVENERSDFSRTGFFSLTFDEVQATGFSIRINREATDAESWTHYPVHHLELRHNPQRLVSKAALPLNDLSVWRPDTRTSIDRGDGAYVIDNRLDTWSYLSSPSTTVPMQFGVNLSGGAQRVNRIRLAKLADLDGVGETVDPANLTVLYTTDTGALKDRRWYPVKNLGNGMHGSERMRATAVNRDGTIEGDVHDFAAHGFASLTFDALNATGLGLAVARPAGSRPYTHYPLFTFEAHYEASLDVSEGRLPLASIGTWTPGVSAWKNGDFHERAFDQRTDTGSYLTESAGTGPYRIGLELRDGLQRINRLRVAKAANTDGTQSLIDNMDLEILYTSDTGPLYSRTWIPVAGLRSGFEGAETIVADAVRADGSVDNDHHDFATDGYYSLTFEAVEATALAINVNRDPADPQAFTHYFSYEIEVHYEASIDPSAKALRFDDIQVWNPADLSAQNRGDQNASIDGTVGTFSYLTPSTGAGPYQFGVNLAAGAAKVNRLRVAKRADLDGVGSVSDRADLEIYYTTDTGALPQRTWHRVTGLGTGIQGAEAIKAEKVLSSGYVRGESHDFDTDGYYSLLFDTVEATGFAIWVNRSAGDSRNYTHYPIYEIEAHYEVSVDLGAQGIAFDDIQVWNPNDGTLQNRGDQQLAIDGSPGTFSYLTPSAGNGPYQVGLNFGEGSTRVNRLRVAKNEDADGTRGAVDRMDLALHYTTDTGPLWLRTWHRVSGMELGFGGEEIPLVDSSSADGRLFGEKTDYYKNGYYSVTFDAVEATGLALWINRTAGDDVYPYTHYPVYEFHALYEPTLEAISEVPVSQNFAITDLAKPIALNGHVTKVDGVKGADLYLFGLQPVPSNPGRYDAGQGLFVWGVPMPVTSATVLSAEERVDFSVGFRLPETYFTDPFNNPIEQSVRLSVDRAGEISIVGGRIFIPAVKIPGTKLTFKNLNLAYDSALDEFAGSLEMEMGKNFADACGLLSGGDWMRRSLGGFIRIRNGEITELTVSGNDLRIPMGASTLNLFQGSVRNPANLGLGGSNATEFAARAVLNGGCPIKKAGQDIFPFTVDMTGTYSDTGFFDLEGAAKVFNVQAANARLKIDSTGVEFGSGLSLLQIFEGSVKMSAGNKGFSGSASGTIKVPPSVPVVGGYVFTNGQAAFSTDGFSDTVVIPLTEASGGECVGGYSVSVGYTGRVWPGINVNLCCIDVWVPRVCAPRIPATSLTFSYKYTAGDGFSFSARKPRPDQVEEFRFRRESTVESDEAGGFQFLTDWDFVKPLSFQKSSDAANTSADGVFSIDDGVEGVIFRATSSEISSLADDIRLQLPSGDVLSLAGGPRPEGFDNVAGYARVNPEAEEVIFYLHLPVAGAYELSLLENPNAAEIEFHALVREGTPEVYIYEAENFYDETLGGQYASVTYFIDNTNLPLDVTYLAVQDEDSVDGFTLGSETLVPEEWEFGVSALFWPEDFGDIAPGEYAIVVVVDDGINPPQYGFTDSWFTIVDPLAPDPIAGLRSGADNEAIHLEWDPSPSDTVEFYKVMSAEDTEADALISNVMTPADVTSHTLRRLVNGRPYLATVVAVDGEGRESRVEEIHRIVPTVGPGFTPPYITSEADDDATAGYLWVYFPIAYDADAEIAVDEDEISPDDLLPPGSVEGFGQLRWSLVKGPTGMTMADSGALQWTPSRSQVGEHEVVIRVTKDLMVGLPENAERPTASSTQRFVVTVLPPENLNGLEDDPYQFISQAPLVAKLDETYRYEPTLLIPEGATWWVDLEEAPDWLSESWDDEHVIEGTPTEGDIGGFVWLNAFVCLEGQTEDEDECWKLGAGFFVHVDDPAKRLTAEPGISGFEITADKAMVTWVGETEKLVIQRATALDGEWETVSGPTAPEAINRFIDENFPADGAFYRVVPVENGD